VKLTAAASSCFSMSDPGSPYEIVFVPVSIDGEPSCQEHIALHWGTPEDLVRLPLAPTDKSFVKYLLKRDT
jgi:hypothetical protein